MTLLSQLLVATALIAALMLIGMFASRCVQRSRSRRDRGRQDCMRAGCFGGCGPDEE